MRRSIRVSLVGLLVGLGLLVLTTPAASQFSTAAFSADSFQHDLFTGGATAQIPIAVPGGAAGTAPKVMLRYASTIIDDIKPTDQAQETGLGWTLDVGGFVLRDMKGTAAPGDDAFRLVFAGAAHELVLVDTVQNLYRTKDETFLRIQYVPAADSWTVTTKDGTRHHFGLSAATRANALREDGVTPLPYKYLLDEVMTTSGAAIRYAYAKATATLNGQPYDQYVYPDTITWTYHNSLPVGPAREVRFTRGARADWSGNTGETASMYFFSQQRIETIEVRVGASLVRTYTLAYDYSIDRDPAYTWQGGATGDLTLTGITLTGTDGSPLPAVTFTYTGGRLATVNNGIGGTVSFAYERVTPYVPLYQRYRIEQWTEGGQLVCSDLSISTGPGGDCGAGSIVAYIATTAGPNMVPLYSRAMVESTDEFGSPICSDWGASTGPGAICGGSLVGYIAATQEIGTTPLWSSQLSWGIVDEGGQAVCSEWGIGQAVPDSGCGTGILGYSWAYLDRHRVTSRTVTDGRGGSITTTYQYTGIAQTLDGKEFRGHATVRVTDPLGHYTVTSFYQDDAKKGRPYEVTQSSATGVLLSRATSLFTVTTPSAGVTLVAVDQLDTTTYDDAGANGRTTSVSFEYDTDGNLTRTYHHGDVAVTGDERNEETEWRVDATNWLHRPVRSILADAGGLIVREKWTFYDGLPWGTLGTRGLATREESRYAGGLGTAGNPAVTFAYDVYGNRTATTDPRGCTTTTAYEASQTYPASVTTCLNHTTTFVHDAGWGVKTSVTDPNGQTTTYTYDAFGRGTMVRGPLDGSSTYGTVSTFYQDFGIVASQRVRTHRTTRHNTAEHHWSESYFDGMGRVYETRAQGPGTNVLLNQTRYDARGLVAGKTIQRYLGTAGVETTFTYDARGRQTELRHPDGRTATTAYLPDRVTLTNERGHVTRRFQDAYGRLTRVEEVDSTQTYATTYEYNVAGALARVQNHAGQVTTLAYDLLGRKTETVDPNMGRWTYAYDLTGNLTGQTDAKSQPLTFTYDVQGRMLTKSYPGGAQITWTYDDPAVPFSQGRVTRIADLATVTTFQYDALGRVTQTARLLDGTTYTMSQTWTPLGVDTQTFPDGETVTFRRNSATWLDGITSPSGNYLDTITYNARGQRFRVTYPNGVVTTHTYNPNNFREIRRPLLHLRPPEPSPQRGRDVRPVEWRAPDVRHSQLPVRRDG